MTALWFSGVVVVIVLTAEYRWWGGRCARALVRIAASVQPRYRRDRCREEWLRHLEDLQSEERHPGLMWSVGNLLAAPVIRFQDAHWWPGSTSNRVEQLVAARSVFYRYWEIVELLETRHFHPDKVVDVQHQRTESSIFLRIEFKDGSRLEVDIPRTRTIPVDYRSHFPVFWG